MEASATPAASTTTKTADPTAHEQPPSGLSDAEVLKKWSTTSEYALEDVERGVKRRNHGVIKGGSSPMTRRMAESKRTFRFYTLATFYVVLSSFVSLCQPLIVDCVELVSPDRPFGSTCHDHRYMELAYLTPRECAFGRRIVFATLFGAFIGWERRQADRRV